MDIREFADTVLEGVKNKAGDDLRIMATENQKNNGVIKTALSVMPPEGKGGPYIHLDGWYEEYQNGAMSIGEITEAAYTFIMEHKDDLKGMDIASILEWENVRECIYAKLVNAGMNEESLTGMPHRMFLDLAVIYCVKVNGLADGGSGFIQIQDQHMEMWGQNEGSLYHMACENMRAMGKPVLEDMNRLLALNLPKELRPFIIEDQVTNGKIYVLTNKDQLFGAAELLDSGTLKEIGDKLGDDFVILPSSVHESIIVKADSKIPNRNYADIVREINREQVLMEERLSDHVYLYEREKGTLKIVA